MCAYVALVPLVFDPQADWPFVVPKALLSHALAFLLVAIGVGLVAQFGTSVFRQSWLHVGVLVFFLVNVLATIFAADHFLAIYGAHARMLGLATITTWIVLYFGVATFVRTRSDVTAILLVVTSSAVFMLLYESVQLLGGDPFTWSGADVVVRPISTNGQPTSLGSYLAIVGVSAAATALVGFNQSRPTRALALIVAACSLAGAAATGTRSILGGIVAGAAVLLVFLWLGAGRRSRLWLVVGVGATTIAVGLLIAFTPLGGRLLRPPATSAQVDDENSVQLDTATLDVRAVLYGVAIDAVRERPLLGYGPDNFVVAMARYRPETGPEEARLSYATSPHGWVGQIAVGSGVLGLLSFLAILLAAALRTYQRFRDQPAAVIGLVAIAALLGTGITTVTDVGTDWVFFAGAGLVASNVIATPETAASPATRARKRRVPMSAYAVPMIGIAVAGALSLLLLAPWDASRLAQSAQSSRQVNNTRTAIDAAVRATSSDSARAEYWRQLGYAHIAAQHWTDAAAALEQAIQRAPWDTRNMSDLITVDLVLANAGSTTASRRARELADQVTRVDPNYPAAQASRARALQFFGENAAALNAIERALELEPRSLNEQWYVMASQLYVAVGRPADAVVAAQRGASFLGARPSLQIELARALLAAGRPSDALTVVQSVLSSDPANAPAQQLLGEIRKRL